MDGEVLKIWVRRDLKTHHGASLLADGIGVVGKRDFNRLGHRALDGWHGRGRPCPQWVSVLKFFPFLMCVSEFLCNFVTKKI